MAERKQLALLIDSDNVSAKYISHIMNELTARHGDVTYRRIYGDWTSNQMSKWKDVLASFSLTPMQQFANTTGKNATDSFMIIDAMDILYEGKVDGFCIVSSDSDFTRLASRLRDAGMLVVGMGEAKTPRSFRAACSVFTNLQLLVEGTEDANGDSKTKVEEAAENEISKKEVATAIADIVSENSGKGAETTLAEIGNRLVSIYPDFDVRAFGYSQLSKFIESCKNLELSKRDNSVIVMLKGSAASPEDVIAFIRDEVERAGRDGCALAPLGDRIRNQFPTFSIKDAGYSKLSKFMKDIPGIVVADNAVFLDL